MELGKRNTWKGYGSKRPAVEKIDAFYYVPILDILERTPSIFEQVAKC